jgi:hypothetical protein
MHNANTRQDREVLRPQSEVQFTPASREHDLLLGCVQYHLNRRHATRIRQLLEFEIDWQHLARLAHEHRVLPLLYRGLDSACADLVPPAMLDRLKRRFNVNRFHNQYLTKELLWLLQLLESHKIAAFPYKGPVLAACAYGDISARQFVDLDIIVSRTDILRAKELLMSRGYKLRNALSTSQELKYLQGDYEYRLVREDSPTVIGLHWALAPKFLHFPLDALKIWNRARQIPFAGTTVLSPPREDLLLMLCVHGAKEQWPRLASICDIASLINSHPDMDWGELFFQATNLHSTRVLLVGIGLAHFLFETDLPSAILEQVQEDAMAMSLITKLMYLRRWLPPIAINQAFWQFSKYVNFLPGMLRPLHLLGKCVTSTFLHYHNLFNREPKPS